MGDFAYGGYFARPGSIDPTEFDATQVAVPAAPPPTIAPSAQVVRQPAAADYGNANEQHLPVGPRPLSGVLNSLAHGARGLLFPSAYYVPAREDGAPSVSPQPYVGGSNDRNVDQYATWPVAPTTAAPEAKPSVAKEVPAETAPEPSARPLAAQTIARTFGDAQRAREAQDFQARQQAMLANAQWAGAWRENEAARRAAQVAAFRATNGADMVLAGGNPAYEQQRQAIIADAVAKGALAGEAGKNLRAAEVGLVPPRNYIDEYGRLAGGEAAATTAAGHLLTGQAAGTVAGSRVTEANARAELEQAQAIGLKLNAEQHRRVLDLGAKLAAAKTPEEQTRLRQAMYAMLGKDAREYDIHPVGGGQTFDPRFPGFPINQPAGVVITNLATGQPAFFGGAQQTKGPEPLPREIEYLKAHPESAAMFEKNNPGYKAADYLKA